MVFFKAFALAIMATGSVLALPTPVDDPDTVQVQAFNHYMDIVGEWRWRLGLSQLQYDSHLESNALDTVISSNGQMIHKLNPGTFAQVLAPGRCGNLDDFYSLFVGGWLCERPDLPGLNGICANYPGWSHGGQTGHADILTSPSYSRIGCACAVDIWSCDLA